MLLNFKTVVTLEEEQVHRVENEMGFTDASNIFGGSVSYLGVLSMKNSLNYNLLL